MLSESKRAQRTEDESKHPPSNARGVGAQRQPFLRPLHCRPPRSSWCKAPTAFPPRKLRRVAPTVTSASPKIGWICRIARYLQPNARPPILRLHHGEPLRRTLHRRYQQHSPSLRSNTNRATPIPSLRSTAVRAWFGMKSTGRPLSLSPAKNNSKAGPVPEIRSHRTHESPLARPQRAMEPAAYRPRPVPIPDQETSPSHSPGRSNSKRCVSWRDLGPAANALQQNCHPERSAATALASGVRPQSARSRMDPPEPTAVTRHALPSGGESVAKRPTNSQAVNMPLPPLQTSR